MTSPPVTTGDQDPTAVPPAGVGSALPAARRWVAIVLRGILLHPIAEGRLRPVNWPNGWAAVVVIGHLGFVAAAVLVLTARLWRAGPLAEVASADGLIPRSAVWLLAWLLVLVAALFHAGAMRCAWWVRIASLLIMLAMMTGWVAMLITMGRWLVVLIGVLAMLAMIVVTVIRIATPGRWWDFAVYWSVLTVPVLTTMITNRQAARLLGFDLPPMQITMTMTLLAVVCIPVAVAAGTAVAELVVSATLWTAVGAGRVSRTRVLGVLLAGAFAVRGVQVVLQVVRLDWSVRVLSTRLLPVLVAAALLAGLTAVLLRRAGRVPPQVTELPDRLGDLALPIGTALLGILLPYYLVLVGVQFWAASTGIQPQGAVWNLLSGDEAASMVHGLLAVALVVLAVRAAARGRIATALLQAHIAILLLPRPLAAITGAPFSLWPDADLLNLLVTSIAFGVLGVFLVRRTLSPARMIGLGATVVLGALLSGRDVVLTPLVWLLGPSAALLLLGLVWTLLTDCDRCNIDGRRFPAAARSVLMLGFLTLAAVVLAYDSLTGSVGSGGLEVAETVGDEILGTALLTSTVGTLLVLLRRDRIPH